MSSDDARISTDELLGLAKPVHVDTLESWPESIFDGDVGQRAIQSAVFGQTGLVYTYGNMILWGDDLVQAQRHQPDDDGMVPTVDFAAAGYSLEKAKAAVLAMWTNARRDVIDHYALAELVTDLNAWDEEIAAAAGWDGDALDDYLAALDSIHGDNDFNPEPEPEEPPPEPPSDPVAKRGDIWLLGDHRIMCGDCRDAGDVATLLDGAIVNLAFTSPPYADRRTYDETSGFKPIHPDEYVEWFEPVQANVAKHLAGDGSWFVNIKASTTADGLDTEPYVLDLVLAHIRAWGWHWATEFCWERNGVPKSVTRRFKNQFEPVYQFARGDWSTSMNPTAVQHHSLAVPVPRGSGAGNTSWDGEGDYSGQGKGQVLDNEFAEGMAYPGNRLPTFAGSHEATGHSAAFPIGLPDFFVRAYTDEGDTVFDPFMGSGSTLLAAHQNNRIGYGMEISPKYCDVICARFERDTGIKPVLESTGEPHSFVEDG